MSSISVVSALCVKVFQRNIPLTPQREEYSMFEQNFDFKIRNDHQKISYEHRVYESVDVRSLFWLSLRKALLRSQCNMLGEAILEIIVVLVNAVLMQDNTNNIKY